MAVKGNLFLSVLLLTLLALCATLALATKDPELKQCARQCKQQHQYDEQGKRECLQQCKEYHKEKEERETEKGKAELKRCQKQCDRQGIGEERQLCRQQCKEKYEREYGVGDEGGNLRLEGEEQQEEESQEQEQEQENPYVFRDEHFSWRVKSEHGRIGVLQKFTKRSDLLRGIENYRVAVVEADPQTFVAPSYWDADGVLFVAKGRGTVTMISKDKRESFNVECGDVIRVPAGTPVYTTNRDENEKLFIIIFLRPVNLPDQFRAFHGPGGENPESFYRAFSDEVLEAAFKTEIGRFKRILRQRQGVIVKASKQQIQDLSHDEGGGGPWPFGGDSNRPFNLLKKHPTQSNKYGQLFEANPDDHKQQLQDLDLIVSFANITKGSMAGPVYNSKATKISVVVDGDGYFEMACPHISSSSSSGKGKDSSTYQKIGSRLRHGTVFIVPAGHPVAVVASQNSNLKLLCFEVNGRGNNKYTLAGKNNIINEMEDAAKELAFGVPARDVNQVLRNQNEEYFFPGPRGQQREGGRASA